MDIVIILLLGICVALLVMVLKRMSLAKNDENDREKQAELLRAVSDSVAGLGEGISKNQLALGSSQSEGVLAQLRQMEERIKTFETTNEGKLEAIRESVSKSLQRISEENTKKLDEIRVTVDEKLNERMTKSFKLVSDQLEAVYKGLGEMQSLAVGVGDLKKVLSNVKTRGVLGEIQLGAILSEILSPEQYETNVATNSNSNDRVEFAVRFPSDNENKVYLPIDAKFPGELYSALQDALQAGDAAAAAECRKQLTMRIKSEAKDIHTKYIDPPHTTSFAVLFLPFEGLYCEAVNLGLIEILQRDYNVSLAGPSTMAAMLNSFQMGFKTLAIRKKSAEVWKVLGSVKTEFDSFADVLEKTQNRLRMAGDELDKLVGVRTRAIQRKLKDIERDDGIEQSMLE